MAPPTTPEKSGGKTRPGANDDLIPLLIAGNPGLTLNCSRMRDIDPQKRTYYALEHKFRKFKARAKEICDAEGAKDLDVGKAVVEKAETKSTSISSNQHEDLIPLIIASSAGKPVLNFNRMKQLDPHGRTASSFEHKFRKYKAAAKEILDADKGKSSKTPTKRRKTKGEGAQGESDNGEKNPRKKRRVIKGGSKNADAGAEVAEPQAKRPAGVKGESLDDEADRETVMAEKETDNANNANEAAEEEPGAKTSDEESEDAKLEAAVAKKRKPESRPKPRKKGLARIVKRELTSLTDTESEDKGELTEPYSVQNERKAVGAEKSGAKGKDSKGEPTTEYLAENAASEPGGATAAGVGESSGAAMLKESAIRLLFE